MSAAAADTRQVMVWKRDAREPFASNDDFWASVAASVDGLLALVGAAALTVLVGPLAVVAIIVPAGLLLRADRTTLRSLHPDAVRDAG